MLAKPGEIMKDTQLWVLERRVGAGTFRSPFRWSATEAAFGSLRAARAELKLAKDDEPRAVFRLTKYVPTAEKP